MNDHPRVIRTGSLLFLAISILPGCAIHYHDDKTGTVHLWGFGHMKMKHQTPNEGVQAVVTGVQTAGIAVTGGQAAPGVSLGYQNASELTAISANTLVSLEGPTSDPFTFHIGSHPPRKDGTQHTPTKSKKP